jgi:hypothetical protein
MFSYLNKCWSPFFVCLTDCYFVYWRFSTLCSSNIAYCSFFVLVVPQTNIVLFLDSFLLWRSIINVQCFLILSLIRVSEKSVWDIECSAWSYHISGCFVYEYTMDQELCSAKVPFNSLLFFNFVKILYQKNNILNNLIDITSWLKIIRHCYSYYRDMTAMSQWCDTVTG